MLTGRRWRKKRYLPDRECSTAFSIKSTIVVLLNRVKLPKLKFPERSTDLITIESCEPFTLIMFYSDMSDKSIEFESKAEDVMVVTTVSDHKAPIRFTRKYLLRGLA